MAPPNPAGAMPTVLVTLASSGGSPRATSSGKVSSEPPPAMVLAVPATNPPTITSSASRRLIAAPAARLLAAAEERYPVRLQPRADSRWPHLRDRVGGPAPVAVRRTDLLRGCPQRQLVDTEPEALAGDLLGRVPTEEHEQRRHVLRHSHAHLLADQVGQRLALLRGVDHLRPAGDAGDHPGDRVGDDGVDGDLGAGQLHRPGARERGDPRLGAGVVCLPEVAALAGPRRDDHDPPATALLAHAHGSGTRAGEGAAHVRLDDRVEVLVGHLPEDLVAEDARVGAHDVDATEAVHRLLHESLRGLRPAHGYDLGDGLGAAVGQFLDGLLGDVGVDIVDDHGGPRLREGAGVGAADTATAAGDNGDLSVEIHGSSLG